MNSLQKRLLLAGVLVMMVFVAITGMALERAFRSSAMQAEEEKLKGLIYGLLGAADMGEDGILTVQEGELGERRILRPDSGLFAALIDNEGTLLWHSPSATSKLAHLFRSVGIGEWKFGERKDALGLLRFDLAFGLGWQLEKGPPLKFTALVSEDGKAFLKQLTVFRRTLWGWLVFAAGLLLFFQFMVLRWGLTPLRHLAIELQEVKEGKQDQLKGEHPTELRPLTNGLNVLLKHERARTSRYENTLGDLAHSLKTPLAVLRGLMDKKDFPDEPKKRADEQIERMDQVIHYQLRKAATVGKQTFSTPVELKLNTDKVVRSLSKVYQDKGISYAVDVKEDLKISVGEEDLLEILGNLIDNASKWCEKKVSIRATSIGKQLTLEVDDDGPGLPVKETEKILKRGFRAEGQTEGQGIGLSVVHEIVHLYGGSLELSQSEWGGGSVHVLFPL